MRKLALPLLLAVAVVSTAGVGAANHADDGTYTVPPFGTPWDTARLEILIVPPSQGQVLNGNGILDGLKTTELDPLHNSYLRAIEDGIAAWRRAIAAFGPAWLRTNLKLVSYVIGRDDIPQAALRDPEIVISTAPHQGEILGLTLQGPLFGIRCTISNARFFVESFTYADMFSVNAHEVGHCLGIDHPQFDHPGHDLMVAVYPHLPGDPDTHKHCPANVHVAVLKGSFGALFGRPGPKAVSMQVADYRRIRC